MKELLKTKVTFINDKYHCRLIKNDDVIDEMACKLKNDIGFCFHTMLRWYDKTGGTSKMACASRTRQKNIYSTGKIWYKNKLR